MKRHIVLAAVFLITAISVFIPSTGKSECAWVLWTKKEFSKTDLSQNIFWEIIDAYPDHNQCMVAKKKIWQVERNQALEDKKKYSPISEIKEVPGELIITNFKDPKEIFSISVHLYCLPGTLDPRERK